MTDTRKALETSEHARLVLFDAIVTIERGLAMAAEYRKRRKLKAERDCIDAVRDQVREIVAAGHHNVSLVVPANDDEGAT